MYRIRKTFKFEASHQLSTAYSRVCTDTIHGHSYIVEVFLTAKQLNVDGMVIDFGELKHDVAFLIDLFDHALVLPKKKFSRDELLILQRTQKKLLLTDYNPTAENMAKHFFTTISSILKKKGKKVGVERVRVHETTTGWAEYQK